MLQLDSRAQTLVSPAMASQHHLLFALVSSARTNGFDFFSSPIVVGPPCPGRTIISSGSLSSLSKMLFIITLKFPSGSCVFPTDPSNKVSPTITQFSRRWIKARLPGVCPGTCSISNLSPPYSRLSPSLTHVILSRRSHRSTGLPICADRFTAGSVKSSLSSGDAKIRASG